jgi:hypothetical protein
LLIKQNNEFVGQSLHLRSFYRMDGQTFHSTGVCWRA